MVKLAKPNPGSRTKTFIVLTALVCLTVCAVQWPALTAIFKCADDDQYISRNVLVRTPSAASAWRFLSEVAHPSTVDGYYQPLSMISLMFDSAIGGQPANLLPYHATSLALHVLNTALLAIFLYLLFDQPWVACGAALLFGLHPLSVEPLAWVGERKTLLAAFFSLASLVAYVNFVRAGGRKWYVASLVLFVMALMSKPTSVPLPAVMLLLDLWPLKRLGWRSVYEKVPFFFFALVSAIITVISQSGTAGVIAPGSHSYARIPLVLSYDIGFYFQKIVRPIGLGPFYAFPEPFALSNPRVLAPVAAAAALVVLLLLSLRWTKAPLVCALVFFVMLLPAAQVLQVNQAIASDKYVYLPAVGVLMALAWGLTSLLAKHGARLKPVLLILVLAAASAEAVTTRHQLEYWHNVLLFNKHMVDISPWAGLQRCNLAMAYGQLKQFDKAAEQLQIVLDKQPDDPAANLHMGWLLKEQGRYDQAVAYFRKAMAANPGDSQTCSMLGDTLVRSGRVAEGIAILRAGLRFSPDSQLLHRNLGKALLEERQLDEAIRELSIAVSLMPDAGSHTALGIALLSAGDSRNGMMHLKEAIRLEPGNPEGYYNLGNAFLGARALDNAAACFRKAIELSPDYAAAHGNLGIALAQAGRLDGALTEFRQVVRLSPSDVQARLNLARILADTNRPDDAAAEYRKLLELDPQNVNALCELGDILAGGGRFLEAAAEYRKAAAIAPNDPKVLAGLKRTAGN